MKPFTKEVFVKSATRQSTAIVLLCALGSAISAQVAGCFKEHVLGTACGIAPCDTSARCDAFQEISINEPVYATSSPGSRKTQVPWGSLCLIEYTIINTENNLCVRPSYCESVVTGSRATGGFCSQPGPF